MDTKICNKCKRELSVSQFHKRNNRSGGYTYQCKECRSMSRKGKHKEYSAAYYLKYKDRQRELEKLNKDKVNARKRERSKERRQTDINYRIKINLRGRIYKAIKRNSKSESTIVLIGCSIEALKVYLSSMFTEGMSWDNYGKWHIDHIKPCASFDLSDSDQQKECFHYSNLQPLWAIENIKKSDQFFQG
jgi:hypothetical protein